MHAVALKLLPQSGEYKTETQEWEKLPEDQQIWATWKTAFREAYVAKRSAEAAREGDEKSFGGSAIFGAAPANEPLRRQAQKKKAELSPITNQMMDSLEGYLDNISAASTKTSANRGPLAELAASLAISVDTVARQQQEIKRLSEQINALKKKVTQAPSGATFPGGTTVCTHCEAVGCTAPHRKKGCYLY